MITWLKSNVSSGTVRRVTFLLGVMDCHLLGVQAPKWSCQPSAIISPSLTSTQPTIGFGDTRPRAISATSRARVMNRTSASLHSTVCTSRSVWLCIIECLLYAQEKDSCVKPVSGNMASSGNGPEIIEFLPDMTTKKKKEYVAQFTLKYSPRKSPKEMMSKSFT